jgi:hypothetical protein
MVIEELRTSSVAMRVNSRGVVVVLAVVAQPVVRVGLVEQAAQVDREALVALVELAAQVDREALVALVELAAQVDREALVELVAQVAREVLAVLVVQVAQVVLGVLVVQVAELEPRLVKAVPGLDPVEVELGHVRVAVPALRTRSVIAAHRHGQVRVRKRVEDLAAAAAEITPEQAATEVAAAWAAAE